MDRDSSLTPLPEARLGVVEECSMSRVTMLPTTNSRVTDIVQNVPEVVLATRTSVDLLIPPTLIWDSRK
jgi:hypothetical protein